MHRRITRFALAAATAGAALSTLGLTAGTAGGATLAAPGFSTLTAISAAHHRGFDRLVFRFRGPVPSQHSARLHGSSYPRLPGLTLCLPYRAGGTFGSGCSGRARRV